MINVNAYICAYDKCKTRPIYNYDGDGETTGIYCVVHKLEKMVNVVSKTCIYDGCTIQPNFNFSTEKKQLYCSTHKLEGMVDIFHKTCKNDWCYTRVQDKYDGYCLFCYINMFPDKPVTRNYKTKEFSVVEFIKNKFPNMDWISDKIIQGGCSKKRPDLLLDLGYQIIIVEIDENQHINYSCENKRVMEISQDLSHRPIIFIRFNPDDYKIKNKIILSCWKIDKRGILVIKKTKKEEWYERLNILSNQIIYWTQPRNISNKTIETIQLFYDEYQNTT